MSQQPDRSHSWFTSRRERRLWVLALVVTAAIFITLGIGPALAGLLRERNLLDGAYMVGLLLVGATVVALASDTRRRGIEVGIVLGLLAIGVLVVPRTALPAVERTHLIEYAVLAAIVYAALIERASHGRSVPYPAVTAFLLTTLIGVIDEGLQALLPNRVFDPVDILFNATAAGVAVTLSVGTRWLSAGNHGLIRRVRR